MRVHILAAAASLLTLAVSSPALAANFDAAAANRGFTALKTYNLIVFNDLTTNQETEGKTFVGGNLNIKDASGNNGAYQSYLKGPAGTKSSTFGLTVGKNVTGGDLHLQNSSGGQVGGSLQNNSTDFNGDATLNLGGTGSVKNQNGAIVNQNVAGLASSIATTRSSMMSDLKELSKGLAGLTATDTLTNPNNGALVFSVAKANTDLAVFTLADFSGLANKRLEYSLNGAKTVIINVTGTSLTLPASVNFSNAAGAGATVLWNFANATSLDFSAQMFNGSILAPLATNVKTGNYIEGAAVFDTFNAMNGEVHLSVANSGTSYAGTYVFPTSTAVPEPASWTIMIAGFGLLGASLRMARRRRPSVRDRIAA